MIPANHPFGIAYIDNRAVPCLIAGWERIEDANGYRLLYARVVVLEDGEPVKKIIAGDRVKKAGQ